MLILNPIYSVPSLLLAGLIALIIVNLFDKSERNAQQCLVKESLSFFEASMFLDTVNFLVFSTPCVVSLISTLKVLSMFGKTIDNIMAFHLSMGEKYLMLLILLSVSIAIIFYGFKLFSYMINKPLSKYIYPYFKVLSSARVLYCRQNLRDLSSFLKNIPTENFNMEYFRGDHLGNYNDYKAIIESKNYDGIIASAIGWAPFVNKRMELIPADFIFYGKYDDKNGWPNWTNYCKRIFEIEMLGDVFHTEDSDKWRYLFDSKWAKTNNTPLGAAQRIDKMLAKGIAKCKDC